MTNFPPRGCKWKIGRLTNPNREVFSFNFSAINLCQTMLNIYKFLFRLKINAKNFIIIDSLISWFNYILISIALLNYWFVDTFIIDKFIFILQEDISLVLLQPINAIQGLYFGEMHPGRKQKIPFKQLM